MEIDKPIIDEFSTINADSVYTITPANVNSSSITITSSSAPDVLQDLRVVEYTKNGKITRVELQRLNRDHDTWVKIPRIKIEEEK